MAGEKVVVIDTNEKVAIQLSDTLKKVGFDATTLQWAEEALALVQQGGIDAVVLRTKLGGMTGFAFTQALRKNPNFAIRPIVILYGKDDQESKVQAFKSGADDYLVLPFPLPELMYRLDVRLRKTIPDEAIPTHSDAAEDSSTGEMPIPASFPDQGSVVSRSLPMLLGIISSRNLTGSLRLTEKGAVRALYFTEGRLRGVRSSKNGESFGASVLWWRALCGAEKNRFKILVKTAQDRTAAEWLTKNGGIRADRIHALASRYIDSILEKTIRMVKADFDWVDKDDTSGILMLDPPGASLFHALLGVFRTMWFPPKYKVFLPKSTQYVFPNTRMGRIADTQRMTTREEAILRLLARGRTLGELTDESARVVSYSEQLIHLCLSFDVIRTSEKRLLTRKEQDAVSVQADRESSDLRDMSRMDVASFDVPDSPDEEQPQPPPPIAQSSPRPVPAPPRPAPPAPAPKSEPRAEPKQSPRVEPRPEPRIEIKPEPRSEPKPEIKSEPVVAPSPPVNRYPLLNVQGPAAYEFSAALLPSGDLSVTHVALPYAQIVDEKLTGVLGVRIGHVESKLFFKRGNLLFVRTDDPKLRVDQIMVDLGMITPEQRERVQESIEELGKMRSGTIIFKRQIVNMVQLAEALHQQIGIILKNVFAASSGSFSFAEGVLPEEEHIPMDLQTASMLLDSLRGMDDTVGLSDKLPDLSIQFHHTARSRELMSQIRLGPLVTQIFDKFRHGTTGREAFVGSEITLREFKSILYGLVLLGLLYRIK